MNRSLENTTRKMWVEAAAARNATHANQRHAFAVYKVAAQMEKDAEAEKKIGNAAGYKMYKKDASDHRILGSHIAAGHIKRAMDHASNFDTASRERIPPMTWKHLGGELVNEQIIEDFKGSEEEVARLKRIASDAKNHHRRCQIQLKIIDNS